MISVPRVGADSSAEVEFSLEFSEFEPESSSWSIIDEGCSSTTIDAILKLFTQKMYVFREITSCQASLAVAPFILTNFSLTFDTVAK